MIARLSAFVYGIVCYAIFFGTFLYAIAFIGNVPVARTMDGAPALPLGQAMLTNVALLALFAVQHSVMARPAFKRAWTRIVPKPVERSTYVLLSSAALLLLVRFWQPMGGVIWDVDAPVGRMLLYGLFASGWLLVLLATFLINHFDLFGLRQVWLYLMGREYTPLRFKTPWLYRYVRHPLYVGWQLTFWAIPTMTVAHLVFAAMTTAYMLIAIQFEERDLVTAHGEAYARYRRTVPMLVPRIRHKTGEAVEGGAVRAAGI